MFEHVVVSTDSEETAAIARHYGAEVPELRPAAYAADLSPDIEWITHMLEVLRRAGRSYEAFAILRPTNPFRRPETIRQAWDEFVAEPGVDSLRAVEKCQEHPGKMWIVRERRMMPLLPVQPEDQPWHSSAYQSLPTVYAQTGALEFVWTQTVSRTRTIAGTSIMPFFMSAIESLDINHPQDWDRANALLAQGTTLPLVPQTPFIG